MSSVTNPSAANEPLTQKQIAAIQADTVMNLQGKLKAKEPETTTVRRFHIARRQDGHILIEQPPRTAHVVSEPQRPGKLYDTKLPPLVAIRDFFEQGEETWGKTPDLGIWKLALEAAKQSNLDGQTCRNLARAVSAGLEIRAGQNTPSAFEAV